VRRATQLARLVKDVTLVLGGSFNYIEIDAETHGNIEHARYLRVYLRGHLGFGCRTVCHCGQKCRQVKRSAADILLKAVEEYSGTTTFIFVLHEVSAVQPALRSRTQAFRLLPLANEVALNRLATVCQTENFSYEDPALEAIVRTCRAFAGQSLRKLFEIANLGPITLARTPRGVWSGLGRQDARVLASFAGQ